MSQQDVIKKFVKSLCSTSKSGTEALDDATNYASGGKFKTWSDLVSSFIDDVKNYGGSSGKLDTKTDSFLKNYCSIDLSNDDTGAITGWDSGGSTIKDAESIVFEANKSATYPTESVTTINGVRIHWADVSEGSAQYNVTKALYTWWISSALDLVQSTFGISYNGTNTNDLYVNFINISSGGVASADSANLNIDTSVISNIDITAGSNSGKVRSVSAYVDRIIAHEMTHAVMNANMNSDLWYNAPASVLEGLAELIHGADDSRRSEIINLAQSSNVSKLETALNTRVGGVGYYNSYAGGYMLFKYLAKQVAGGGHTGNNTVEFKGTANVNLNNASGNGSFVVNSSSSGLVYASFTTDTINRNQTEMGKVVNNKYTATFNTGQVITAAGSDKNWNIVGTAGNDTITGGSGSDTLTGGEGADLFVFNGSGSNVITDYTENVDRISISNSNFRTYNYNISGNDVIFTIGNETLTIKNAKNKKININNVSQIYPIVGLNYNDDKTSLEITDDYGSTLEASSYHSSVVTIDASNRTSALNITGNNNSNVIKGSSGNDVILGGIGADSIEGGEGDDTLTGGSGRDVFIYTSGNDVITDYAAGQDTIRLTGDSISSASLSGGDDVVLIIGTGSITVKNADTKKITVIDSNGNKTSKIYAEETLPTGLKYNSSKKILTASADFSDNVIDLSDYNHKVKTLNASVLTDNVSLVGNSNDNVIKAGAGDDTISSGSGSNTLTGGKGADVFICGGEKNIITDYAAGEDKIILGDDELSSIKVSSKNIIFTATSSKTTIKNGKGKAITIIDSSGNETTQVYYNTRFITNDDSQSIKASSTLQILDASKRTADIKITGNAKSNTLIGGSGNDTLKGGAGKDVFIYSAGNDLITDYSTSDSILIKNTEFQTTNYNISGKDVIFSIDTNNSLTIKGGKDKKITITDATGNTTTQKYSNASAAYNISKIEEPWFAVDDNVVTTGIESIIKTNATVQNVSNIQSTDELDKLTQNAETLINISESKKNVE